MKKAVMTMRIATFKRGVHPPQSKSTSGEAIEVILPKKGDTLLYPMLQHIGAPCKPCVVKGESVAVGQKIGDSEAYVCAPVHSSVSGVVTDIRSALLPTGVTTTAVCVENDDQYRELPTLNQKTDYKALKREELLQMIREAGIVGLGGAGFPTHVKLNPPPDKPIDTVIVNAAECEPYLTNDHRVLLEETEKLLLGLKIILHMFPNAAGIIAVETNKWDAIKALEKANCFEDIRIVGLTPKYPQGSEKQLINACMGREVPSGGLPADVGCIVQNLDTVIALHRVFYRGRPLMRKIITVAGGAVNKPGNYKVRIGMRYRDLIAAVGGLKCEPHKMISGGPMMGVSMFTMDVPVIKTSSGFLAFTEEEAKMPPEINCIRCGRCVSHCPAGLMPLDLNQYVIHGEQDRFVKNNGLDCIECGVCTYVCPAKRHLTQSIRAMRRDVLAARKK